MKKRDLAIIILSMAAAAFMCIPAYANSAMTFWSGTDAAGVVSTEGDCPLEVVHETLTFDLPDTAKEDLSHEPAWSAYRNSYTAEYEIYNPSDLDVSAVLSFPFGTAPVYAPQHDSPAYDDETRYAVLINGEKIKPEVRYSYLGWRKFDVKQDLSMLKDIYMEDSFFRADLPVNRYLLHLEVNDADQSEGPLTEAACELPARPEKNRYQFGTEVNGIRMSETEFTAGIYMNQSSADFVMNVFGEAAELPEWHFETSEADPKEKQGTWQVIEQKTMTYEEYVMETRPADSPISPVDYYNALTERFIHESENLLILPSAEFMERGLMKWYRYSIDVKPGETIINSVTAPALPSLYTNYEDPLQEYTYLLSPASLWKKFGSLDVIVNTDEYLISSQPALDKAENGYSAHFENLPEGELQFSLCVSQNPKRLHSEIDWAILLLLVMMFVFIGLTLTVIIKVIKMILKRKNQ